MSHIVGVPRRLDRDRQVDMRWATDVTVDDTYRNQEGRRVIDLSITHDKDTKRYLARAYILTTAGGWDRFTIGRDPAWLISERPVARFNRASFDRFVEEVINSFNADDFYRRAERPELLDADTVNA